MTVCKTDKNVYLLKNSAECIALHSYIERIKIRIYFEKQ